MKVKLVVATRVPEKDFFTHTPTGRSLAFTTATALSVRVFGENRAPLPVVYNQAIRESINEHAVLVFMHDDLHLTDYFWVDRVHEGLKHFDIVGLAGNVRRLPRQAGWAFLDDRFTWDAPDHLSGIVGHGKGFPPSHFGRFGPVRRQVALLDGLFLATRSDTLRHANVYFDERFDFHFYDIDFCRQAEQAGLRCGTWDIAVVHESGGSGFNSAGWRRAYQAYLEKWGD